MDEVESIKTQWWQHITVGDFISTKHEPVFRYIHQRWWPVHKSKWWSTYEPWIIFVSTYSLQDYVANVCRSINFNLYSNGKIQKLKSWKVSEYPITSRLDYCNSLMFSIPKEFITNLQMLQNHAARVITQWHKSDHITQLSSSISTD